MFRKQVQGLGNLIDHGFDESSVFSELAVEGFVFDHVQFIVFIDIVFPVFFVDVVEHVSEGAVAVFIDKKGTGLHYRVAVHFQEAVYALVVYELSFWGAVLEEVVAEPDLSQVSLVFVGGVYLFDCEKGFGFEVESFPYF